MNRTSLLLGHLFSARTLGAGALLLAACAGKVVPFSSSSPPDLAPVNVSDISAPVAPCSEGFAHPNVCCEASPDQAASCGVYPGAPFLACDPTAMTYPDPRSCCPLDGSTDCVAPPPVPTPAPSPPSCGYACPAGQYQPEGSAPGTCCFNDGSLIACAGVGWAGGAGGAGGSAVGGSPAGGGGVLGVHFDEAGAPTETFDAGVGLMGDASVGIGFAVDGGESAYDTGTTVVSSDASCGTGCACPPCVDGESCPACECPALVPCPPPPPVINPPPPVVCGCPACLVGETCPPCGCSPPQPSPPAPLPVNCGDCPPGWQVPAGQPFLCCTEGPSGTIACFSQAVPPSPEPLPAPVPVVTPGPIAEDAGSTVIGKP
jgi:hypothetical protein